MRNTVFAKINATAIVAYVAVVSFVGAAVASFKRGLRPSTSRLRPTAHARAVTFIEYGLLALIAIVIGLVFKTQLSSLFNSIFGNVSNGATNVSH